MYRIGFSKDIHILAPNRKLILGGIDIPSEVGEKAHSDGDVLLHAVSESILGALALGDLGTHFPDNDDKYKDISSEIILLKVMDMMLEKGYQVKNIDTFISLEKPKLKNYIPEIRNNLARLLSIDISKVSVKAGTNEGVDAVGTGKAIEAYAYILLEKKEK